MKPAFCFLTDILLALPAWAQIPQPREPRLDEFSAACSTQWDGNSWVMCQTQPIMAESTFPATFCVTAPSCGETCYKGHIHYPDSRWAELWATNMGEALKVLSCPAGEPCPQCCLTYHWTAQQGVSYYIKIFNTTFSQDCGPTRARFGSAAHMPECVYP